MAYKNPLYHEIFPELRKELNSRAAAYATTFRGGKFNTAKEGSTYNVSESDAQLLWSYGKTALAKVSVYKVDSATGQPIKGTNYSLNAPNNTLTFPSSDKENGSALYSMAHRNLPRGVTLSSVSISNEGQMGSLQKAAIEFTVYTPEDLYTAMNRIMVAGYGVDINYGWSVRTGKYSKGSFKGVVFNYNWDVNDDGSFSCHLDAVGKGYFGMGVPTNASIKHEENGKQPADEAGFNLQKTNLTTVIDSELASLVKNTANTIGSNGRIPSPTFGNGSVPGDGYGYVVLGMDTDAEDTGKSQESGATPSESSKTPPEPKPIYYLTLNDLVNFFNKQVIEQNIKLKQAVQYAIYDSDSGKGSPGTYSPDLVSCIPNEILFSDTDPKGMSTYGDMHYQIGDYSVKDLADDCPNTLNLARIWVSTDTIKEAFEKITKEKATQPELQSVSMFFDEIFGKISYASGEVLQLSITMREDVESGKQALLWIFDKNWSGCKEDQPFIFGRSIHRALLRKLNMSSKLPGAMATQAYVGGRSNATAEMAPNPGASKEDLEKVNSELADREKVKLDVYKARFEMGKIGVSKAMSDQLNAQLRLWKTARGSKDKAGMLPFEKTMIYPVELSLTIDGISGFRFGDIITVDYLPKNYRDAMVFVVTKVEHDISDNDWQTSLTVQARMKQVA